MKDVKCECGHANPVGTTLCEACGNPIGDAEKTKDAALDMRYEGVARRSQIHNRTVIDKVWNFFSSVRIAVWMIVITLIASVVGTIFPQEVYIPVPEPANIFYEKTYGMLGKIYYLLGFDNLYWSWWYVTLLLMIGISLIVCSIDRLVPLYKALRKQKIKHSVNFLVRQKVNAQISKDETWTAKMGQLESALRKRRFQVRREGEAVLAEKYRFSRWGPYINHIGLIIIMLGAILRLVPGFYLNQYVWVKDGDIKKIPNTEYYVKNQKFTVEYYNKSDFPENLGFKEGTKVVKMYKTDAILYKNENAGLPGADPKLVEVDKYQIEVNHPLKYKTISLYQAGQQPNSLSALNVNLVNEKTGKEVGKLKLDLFNPKSVYQINAQTKVEVLEYYPDFELTADKKPSTKSTNPNNPAFILNVISPETPKGEKSWLFLGSSLAAPGHQNVYGYQFDMPDLTNITGIMARMDQSLPIVYFGCFICMLGLIMGFYWQHRRIWVQTEGDKIYVAGHTNKNWFGLKKEVQLVFEQIQMPIVLNETGKGGE
jgi:cytochrome c biogenesis protein